MKFTYLLVNFFAVIVPFVFSFHPKIQFNKNFKSFFKANLIVSLLFLIWDSVFTAMGVWRFNDDYTIGINIFNLPLEELLFFVCIPFACVFTFHCSQLFFRLKWNLKSENVFVLLSALFLLITGIYFWQKVYTSSTFISTAILLLVLKYYFKVEWLSEFFTVYLFLLIPFFIVNGVLTGTGLEQPVVIYNDNENLGIRLNTIPVEDVIFGLELLLLNIFFYKRFVNISNNKLQQSES